MTDTPRFRVDVAVAEVDGDRLRRHATVTSPALGTRDLWYAVDIGHADHMVTRADPFVVATLVLAMAEGLPMDVVGAPIDAGLLRNLTEFQRIWDAWFGYTPVPIHVESTASDATSGGPSGSAPTAAAVAFSGGADSAFSAWWHTRGDGGNDPPLQTAMMIHGVDIPLDDPEGFGRASARARRMSDSIGLDHVVVETNAWDLPVPTPHYTGMGVSAALHVLGGAHRAGLIPSTASYPDLVVELNSSPVSDWLLGGTAFAVVHDAARFNRFEKLAVLTDWPEALSSLRVCLSDPRRDRNCGTCHKCMMTLAAFRLLGITASCFDRAPTGAELTAWARRWPSSRYYQQEGLVLVDEARARDVDESWVRALRNRIRVAQLKDGVRAAWPGLADGVAGLHERVAAARPTRR